MALFFYGPLMAQGNFAGVQKNLIGTIYTESKNISGLKGWTFREGNVIAFPNPSAGNFTINVKGNSTQKKITMQVIDMYGRVIETRNVSANSMIRIGDGYRSGIYFVRIIQGKEHKEIKLIKLAD